MGALRIVSNGFSLLLIDTNCLTGALDFNPKLERLALAY